MAPAGPTLNDRQRLNWLRLIRTENVGPASFRGLINRFGSAEAALAVLPELALAGGARRRSRIPSEAEAEQEMETARRFGARFAAIGEPDYPPMLRCMELPPPLIAVKGDAALFQPPAAAIVGARNASAAGTRMARMLAAGLGRAGFVVVSGLARGIDAAAHEASLATGTVAVLAGGLDRPYPPENVALTERIAAEGVLISEMPFGHVPRARDFPRRNRLVAGLGLGLVVVEAAQRSGSLISARLAGEMGRLVFAVPGSPLDPRAAGTNGLIKDGATLVTQAQDVVEALTPLSGAWDGATRFPPMLPIEETEDFASVPPPAEGERAIVLEALGPTPVHCDELLRHTGLHPAQLATVLLELDLAGRLERHAGGAVSLLFPDP
ncbi:MAG: DNA-processing protein DprA [Aquamicrobium sp.]|uniref:DNA-processing protein DprA n=1 Tax=Aquamicrobium sp. TaxID=1872579 RepID=UPI00349EFF91|nr:DNA-processing protein DprA [Aquamicrobium sp.]